MTANSLSELSQTPKLRLIGSQVHQRDILAAVLDVVQLEVPLAESSAADILTAEADRMCLRSSRLPNASASPNAQSIAPAGQRLAALIHEALQLRMQMEIRRNGREPVDDAARQARG